MNGDTLHSSGTSLRLLCQETVRALSQRYRWALLSERELVDLVDRAAQEEKYPVDLTRLVVRLYSITLFEACRQTTDVDLRERGFAELYNYLYRVARSRWPDQVEDVIQQALVHIYQRIDRCRNPSAFLAFAMLSLRDAVRAEDRSRSNALELDSPSVMNIADPEATMPFSDEKERLQVLQDALNRLDDRQRQVVLLRFLDGLSDKTIGARLQITPGSVRVLRYRALKSLQNDDRLREYFGYSLE